MTDAGNWAAVGVTVAAVVLYEGLLLRLQRRAPEHLARAQHADLRADWFLAVSAQPGSEVLAVQTLRNSLMSATMLASTAALALMGTVTLAAPSLHAGVDRAQGLAGVAGLAGLHPRQLLELVLLALLCASLISTMMAVRLYHHVGFIGGMPVASEARQRWAAAGLRYVRRAGVLYGVGLRQLVLVVPVVAALLLPMAGPPAALLVVALLYSFDRYHDGGTPHCQP